MRLRLSFFAALVAVALLGAGCGDGASEAGGGRRGGSPGGSPGGQGMPWGPGGGPGAVAAVPVEIAPVVRRPISSFIETNGTLEAENEVDIVARTAGPIVELNVEEGDLVRKGQTLARLDDAEYKAQLEIARVELNESQLAYERAQTLQKEELISPESYDQAQAAYEGAKARRDAAQIELDYTNIVAPFDALIVTRYVKFAQQVSVNTPLFRVSDFDPLLCPIRVPERDLPKLQVGQKAYLTVESWPDQRFEAKVLRISPVVEASTGTIKVTLETRPQGKLRPGMFARVFVETATRRDALVIPKAALSLESIGDTVYVAEGETAQRREVELGFAEGDFVQVVSGLREHEQVVVVGQDGLSNGTPIQVLHAESPADADEPRTAQSAGSKGPPAGPPGGKGRVGGRPRLDPDNMTPEQIERAKQFMRARGMTEQQIEERLKQARRRAESETR